MLCSRKSNNLVNKVVEEALRLTYQDNQSNFRTLLKAMEHRGTKNTAILMTEIYKIKTNPAPPIWHHLFQFHENTLIKKFNLNLSNFREPQTHGKKTSNYGLETVL